MHMAGQPRAVRGLLQPFAAQHSAEKGAVVGRRRLQRKGSAGRVRRHIHARLAFVRHCEVALEARLLFEARRLHAQRFEHQPLHRRLQRLAGDRSHDGLQIAEADAGVAEPRAGLEVHLQRLVLRPQVGQAAGVREQVARGDGRECGIARQYRRNEMRQRFIERQRAGIHQLERRVGHHRFRERGGLEHRLRVHRLVAQRVSDAERGQCVYLAVAQHSHRHAGDASSFHQGPQACERCRCVGIHSRAFSWRATRSRAAHDVGEIARTASVNTRFSWPGSAVILTTGIAEMRQPRAGLR